MRITVRAPAKVNLFLRVLAREETGYHRIETLFQALELHDTVEVERRTERGVALDVAWADPPAGGDDAAQDLGPPEENLAYRAAAGYRARGGLENAPGVHVRLTKRIPAGAGLGGGSSDAAAVLRAMDRIHDGALAGDALPELAASLGSDVPFFLGPGPLALGWGRGERLLGLTSLEARPLLVVVPPFRISTADAYRRLAETRASAGPDPMSLTLDDLSSWAGVARRAVNDFEEVVLGGRERTGHARVRAGDRDPTGEDPIQARRILELLRAGGADPALLSGSGSALFGVFPDEGAAEGAAEAIRSEAPAARVVRTATLEVWHEITTA